MTGVEGLIVGGRGLLKSEAAQAMRVSFPGGRGGCLKGQWAMSGVTTLSMAMKHVGSRKYSGDR